MVMRVKEVAALSGVSVRTLHHYDEIGLLKPAVTTEAGYRIYSDGNLSELQQILYYRAIGFSLKQIKEILRNPSFNRLEALESQRQMLHRKRTQLDDMIKTIERTIKEGKGEVTMSHEERFKGFDFSGNPYEQEAKDRWGEEIVDETTKKMNQFGSENQEKMNEIYRRLAEVRHLPADSEEAQATIGEWYQFLNTIGTYSLDAFAGLGEMYMADERFKTNIDQFGQGLACFMRDAMKEFTQTKN
ncbi:MerR family transcriptional regulator [Sporosarcina gallistercoris]|uniref:MerR family transcriptional regulator n=1 Tax=Sporosarcina gallistercoris TaxID=2762245 RepID=A0ABR8PIY4_9BACL|nr:MerR family transcriptional regulator [Sporosarcina gallistercoris]MBD7908138.1 MerR family transcriptional regulator [Sporosarcina gallistercoris]